jgi:hypothetical protein
MNRIYVLVGLSSLLIVSSACKTTNDSSQKSLNIENIENLSLEGWVSACNAQLRNPESAAQSMAELQDLAQTTDCAKAYPIVKSIVEQFSSR